MATIKVDSVKGFLDGLEGYLKLLQKEKIDSTTSAPFRINDEALARSIKRAFAGGTTYSAHYLEGRDLKEHEPNFIISIDNVNVFLKNMGNFSEKVTSAMARQ